jgi:feruloyl esterase
VLLCKQEDTKDCLTQPQLNALKALYGGSKNSEGEVFFPGFSMGNETSWREWVVGEDPEASLGARFVRNNFRYIVTGDSRWNALTADIDAILRLSKARSAADLDSANPDLNGFAARGGKLILYHGWNDPAISPGSTVNYYQAVRRTLGDQKADSFVRLYMVPGMEHCANGPGPSAFGQFGMETAKGPKYGLFDSLQDWVEKGSPSPDVVATKYEPGEGGARKVVMTRPLCAYPKTAKYNGTGDTNDAASFTCAEP